MNYILLKIYVLYKILIYLFFVVSGEHIFHLKTKKADFVCDNSVMYQIEINFHSYIFRE